MSIHDFQSRTIHSFQRIAVFLDERNIYWSMRDHYRNNVDFSSLLRLVVARRSLVMALAYTIYSDKSTHSIDDELREAGFDIRRKNLKVAPDGSFKGDWDIGIGIDIIALMAKVNTVAIISGDGDYCELVRHIKHQGIRCEVYGFPETTAKELFYTAHEYFPLNNSIGR